MRTLLAAAAGTALVAAGLLFLVWWGQEQVVFQPPAVHPPVPSHVRQLKFFADDGTELFALLVGDTAPARNGTLVIHFHGNAEVAAWEVPWAQELGRRTGAAVLLAEYRGYAGIPGRAGYVALGRDADALWRTAQAQLSAVPERTVLHGFSLGSAVAAELARSVRPARLVLESPFTSAAAMAARSGPLFRGPLWRAVARVHYDTRAVVAGLDVPVWVAHGEADGIIPHAMGREVFAAAASRGEFLAVPSRGHNDLRESGEYWNWLRRATDLSSAPTR